jgi:DNA-binding Lrp family transcriptional regulator
MEVIKSKLDKIDNSKLLSPKEIKILNELDKAQFPLFARDISEEVDVSSNVVASRCKKLDEESGLVNRKKQTKPYKYEITDEARRVYFL